MRIGYVLPNSWGLSDPRDDVELAVLAEALGVGPRETWAGAYLLAILDDEYAVRNLTPDIGALKPISGAATQGPGNVAVSALADAGGPYDVVSRFFAPGSGIRETASASFSRRSASPARFRAR